MQFIKTKCPGVILISPKVYQDSRGYFFEYYRRDIFEQQGIQTTFVQENQSFSRRGTLRGLHFQRPPHGQAKLIRVIAGAIYDVAVDIDPKSSSFGSWTGHRLSDENKQMLYIPDNYAHGFYVLSDTATIAYQCGSVYRPEAEVSLLWNDPDLQIDWPIDPTVPIQLSDKDRCAVKFSTLGSDE